jgi:hypothetical protein
VSSVRRVNVGASGSAAGLRALRYAQHLARDFEATLMPVIAWLPPDGDVADRRTPCDELRRIWVQDARQRLQDVLDLAWGTPPPTCRSGLWSGAASLARCWSTPPAAPAYLLVVGAGRRGALGCGVRVPAVVGSWSSPVRWSADSRGLSGAVRSGR